MSVESYFPPRQQEVARLEEKFRKKEQDALSIPVAKLGQYPCFRLDGIKVSKRFLKGSLHNKSFQKSLRFAIKGVYRLFRQCTGEEYGAREEGNFFLCAICCSDEVSFILNNRRNHLENRLFKIGTSLAGTLSGALSLSYQTESKKLSKPNFKGERFAQVVAFDARPLVLEGLDEVEEYVLSRWFIAGRNMICKVLRLAEVLHGDHAHDLGRQNQLGPLCKLVEQHGLEDRFHEAMMDFSLFLPSELTHDADFSEYHPSNGTDGIDELRERLRILAQ